MTPAREGAVSFPRPGAARGHIDPASSCAPLVDELCTHLAQCCIFSEKEAGKREGGRVYTCHRCTRIHRSLDMRLTATIKLWFYWTLSILELMEFLNSKRLFIIKESWMDWFYRPFRCVMWWHVFLLSIGAKALKELYSKSCSFSLVFYAY